MSCPDPRAGGTTPKLLFAPAQTLDHLAAYEARERNKGGTHLREQGLQSSLITEWRRLRDAGVLEGKKPTEKVGKLTAQQAKSPVDAGVERTQAAPD